MSFMNAYKRLDNLCKSFHIFPKGITSYIEEMEKYNDTFADSDFWMGNYNTLKKYRYIRNKISHDTDVYESSFCTPNDEAWLDNFYNLIATHQDPLYRLYSAINNGADIKAKPISAKKFTPPPKN